MVGNTRLRERPKERGASLVEFAILAPLLIALLLGIVEFGWLIAQSVEIRHAAREGARLAATNYINGDADAIIDETCTRLQLDPASVTIALAQTGPEIGEDVTVTVTAVPDPLTGFFTAILPASIDSVAETRMEQTATWSNGSKACP